MYKLVVKIKILINFIILNVFMIMNEELKQLHRHIKI